KLRGNDMAEFGTQQAEGDFDWSEMLHSWLFKGRIAFQRLWWVFLLTIAGIATGETSLCPGWGRSD
ncbi:MAG: hypothetical protein ACF787_04505, partial [Rhodopirellula sp. JB053]